MRSGWLALLFCFSLVVAAEDGLPDTEEALLEYAAKHANRREWVKADQAYRAFLERYPASERRAEVHYQLGRLNLYAARRPDEAGRWYDALIARFPDDPLAWPARAERAEVYAREKRVEAAVALLRKVATEAPDARLRGRAAYRLLAVQEKSFGLSVRQSFTVGQTPTVTAQGRRIDGARFRMERVPDDEILEFLSPERLDLTDAARRSGNRVLVKDWTAKFEAPRNEWFNETIELPAVEAGVYLVEAATEGLTFRVTVLVNTFGLVSKSGADGLLVFAQERREGDPQGDLRVRLVTKDGATERTTDAQGLCRFPPLDQPALLVGTKDGESCFGVVHAWNRPGPESRVYVTTDRPLYRPGHTVHWKVLHRLDEDGTYGVREGLSLRVLVLSPKNETVQTELVTLNAFGTAHGSFELSEEPPLGEYAIRIEPLEAMPGAWNDWSNRGRFRVDEYRKPEYEVDVTFGKSHTLQGERLHAVVEARYFFGSPVAGAKLRYSVRRAPHWAWWGVREEPWMEWYADRTMPHGVGEEVDRGEAELDAQGRFVVSCDIPAEDRDQRYSVVATVTDAARRQEQGAGSIVAYRAAVSVRLESARSVHLAGQEIDAKVSVRDHDGAAVAGQRVTVHALRRVWTSGAKEYREIPLAQRTVTTGASGEADAAMRIDDAGSIVLRAVTADAKGRRTDDERWIWVTSRDWDGGSMNWHGVTIVPDKPAYRPGETATFLLTSEVKDIHLLFTLECRRIYHHQVVKMNGHTATVQVKLDDRGLLPNFFATVTGLHANRTYMQQVNVAVDPTERFLNVEIRPDRTQYKPGEPARFEIVTTDAEGNPVAAELELAGVDEAIYALQPEYADDIRAFFLRRRWNQVGTQTTVQYSDWGRAEAKKKGEASLDSSGDDGGAAEGFARAPGAPVSEAAMQGGLVEPVVRTRFADTLLWRPAVATGADGRATVSLDRLTDNLTTWRLTARGMEAGGRMGQARTSVLVRKEVIARLQVPRFFTQGDRTTITALVRNDLDREKRVQVVLAAKGIAVEGETTIVRTIGPRQEARLEWRAPVERPGTATFVLKAMTDTESDALETKVPILPHGSLQWVSRSGRLDGEVTETIEVGADAMPEATSLTIDVTPTHAAVVLEALDYLADYPYGCVEQTMSRFLPSTITRQVLRRLDIRKPWLEEHLPAMIRAGIDRLDGFQHPDGGWGWWKNDASNPFTTAYVVYGLALAREADAPVPERVLAGGVAALQRMIGDVETDEERVYLLYALSQAGREVPGVRNALADGAGRLPPAAQAMLVRVLHRDGEAEEAKRVLALLVAAADRTGATASWKGDDSYRWTGHAVEATALALEALLDVAPGHEILPSVVAWLALRRDGGCWVSTRQTALVVLAMARYLERAGTAPPRMKITLELNGETMWTREVSPDNWATFDGSLEVPASKLASGPNRVVLKKEGTGSPVYSLYLRQFRHQAAFEPSQGGLRVDRSYQLVRDGKLRGLSGPVRSGDELLVTLTVRADRRYDYLMIEDPMPSGFEAVRDEASSGRGIWTHWWTNREFRDEKVAIAVTRLDAGERTVAYRMRAEQPGTFRVLPTRVWNMYRPGEGANGSGAAFEVLPEEAR